MPYNKPSFPGSVWNGLTNNPDRVDLNANVNPNADDWERIAPELMAVQANSLASEFSTGLAIAVLQSAYNSLEFDHTASILSTNPNVYADGSKGGKDPLNEQAGWHFKNTVDLTEKINWYYMQNQNPTNLMLLGTLTSQYAVVHVRESTSGCPYFVHYTQRQNDGNDAGSWYRSRIVYSLQGSDLSAHVGNDVLVHWGPVPNVLPSLARVECTLDTFATVGPRDTLEEISIGNLSTSTGYPAGYYEFIVKQMGYTNSNIISNFVLLNQTPLPPETPVGYSNTHYVTLDATNDYIDLDTPGIEIDFNKSWTVAISIESVSSINDSSYITLLSSGGNSVNLRKGGTNWGVYVSTPTGNVWQANTWHAPVAGSKIIIRCNGGVGINYYLHDAHDGGMWVTGGNFNSHYLTGNAPEANKMEIGKGGNLISAYFTAGYWYGGLNNVTVWNDYISDEMLTEYLSSDDVTGHSYYAADVADFLPLGEDAYPAVNGLKGAITGTLENGTPEDFVERP